jgi:hypothetical protein
MNITAMAKTIDDLVHNHTDDPFEIDALLYACDNDGAHLLGTNPNPYELLVETKRPSYINAVALVMVGYASPHNPENPETIRPSQHPERYRIRIVTMKTIHGFSNIMRREDEPDEAQDLGGDGQGAICDALNEWWEQ